MTSLLLQETLTYNDTCKALGCSRSYINKLKNAGELPYIIHAGKVRFYAEGINAYCERLKEQAMCKELRPLRNGEGRNTK